MAIQKDLNGNVRKSFPQTQYLGSKERFVDWILKFVPNEAKSAIDAFSGSSAVGYALKRAGLKVISNDLMKYSYYISKALIENNNIKLTDNDIKVLLSENVNKDDFLEREFTNLFYTREECKFLDNLWFNIQKLDNDYKKALAYTAICRTLTRKVLFGYFCHKKAMEYRTHEHRVHRNPSINQDIKELFLLLLAEYNEAVFSNNKTNVAHNKDILEVIKDVKVDLAYFDPPYVGVHPNYHGYYHFLETFVDYKKDSPLKNGTKMSPRKHSGFTKRSEITKNLENLFENSKHIPYWLISYNSRAFPSAEIMIGLIKKHKNVRLEQYKYEQNFGGMGGRKGSKEYLFACEPKA